MAHIILQYTRCCSSALCSCIWITLFDGAFCTVEDGNDENVVLNR